MATRRLYPVIRKTSSSYVMRPEDRMTRLEPRVTGLPMHICISMAQPNEAPCVKVASSYSEDLPGMSQLFSFTIPGPVDGRPEVVGDVGHITRSDLKKVEDFIGCNRDVLVKYWYQMEGWQHYRNQIQAVRKNLSWLGFVKQGTDASDCATYTWGVLQA
ncbi:hypothetical protein ABBQ38_009552 [Trebouxia sp. C0009 RCD-2024]